MDEQTTLFAVEDASKKSKNVRRRWENGFQNWCNKEFEDGTNELGACGYGVMCDYCIDNSYGRPCVRALNAMCRDRHITIDYANSDYEMVWRSDNG